MKLMHLPASRIGSGDILVVATGAQSLPVSLEVWSKTQDDQGVIRFYVRESTTWQLTMRGDETVAVFR